jgi:hypothetical protein
MEQQIIPGCFEKYLHASGDFVTAMAKAICRADNDNLERIRLAFPQMVAAHECHSWFDAPEGFEPKYNGGRITGWRPKETAQVFETPEDSRFQKPPAETHN